MVVYGLPVMNVTGEVTDRIQINAVPTDHKGKSFVDWDVFLVS